MKTMKKIKYWILSYIIARFYYKRWISMRDASKDEYGEKLCYCGHTHMCQCGNPDEELFREAVKRRVIRLWDKKNGWRSVHN